MDTKTETKTPIQLEIEKECIAIVDRERVNWEEAVSFVTPKVAFRMRELIRILRKNYWGVFDNPTDKNTQREKIWINMAMSTVETWVKNIDLDTKDIGFLARTEEGIRLTEITRLAVKDYLDRIYFGETLDADERQVLIDGTLVWKTWEDRSTGKPVMKRRTVDLLNFYIDPTEENIQSAYRVTERAILLPSQIEGMNGWMNTKNLPGSQVLNRADGSRRSNFGTRFTANYRDVWECWGKVPKWVITGDKEDKDAMCEVDGHIVVSGLEAPKPTLHLVEENKRKDHFGNIIKPYEEWRPAKIAGRWYGIGPIERILALQEYLNTIVNIRVNKHYISQLGLFKIRKGKGITPAMLSRLTANGAIQLDSMDDIEPLTVPQEDGTTYKDEEVIKYWAQQISSAMPISNGDTLPASTAATIGSIASTAAKSSYTLFKEATGNFLERWMDRGALPIIAKTISPGTLFKLTREDDRYKELVENIAVNRVAQHLDESNVVPTPEELMAEVDKEVERLLKAPQIFIKSIQKLIADGVETKVHITNEDLDTSVTINNLLTMYQITPNPEIIRQVYDLMGLEMPKMQPVAQGVPGQPQPTAANVQGLQQQATTQTQ